MTGQLFTQYFLTEGITATAEWEESCSEERAFNAFKRSLSDILTSIISISNPNESVTEQEVVRPILELLGWREYLPQQGADSNQIIPDHLLFADGEAKSRAMARANSTDGFQDAMAIEESKRFGLPLDNRDQSDTRQIGTPHGQILRYLAEAQPVSDGQLRWGILTNGAVWRLYDYRSRPRATGFYEADLPAIFGSNDDHALRAFLLLFRRDSFIPLEGAATTYLENAIAEGKRYEQQVAADLSEVVFERVFPTLVSALAGSTSPDSDLIDDLTAPRHAALIFLYRLLFILYAEDRGLLPVNDSRYIDYGLRKRVRDDVAARMTLKDTFSSVATNYYGRLASLFEIIDKGDPSIGLPPYNGGLFSPDAAPLLQHVRLSDAVVAPIIYDLSHTRSTRKGETGRSFVNYRDMSVQQLGSIYERLLEREPVRGNDGAITTRPNPYARKDSGSFYTPQELVDLIVEKTLQPLVEERLAAFEEKAGQLKSDRRPKAERQQELAALDPAEAVLDLKILDPAMGSGHFLVTAVDFLSDYIADLVEYVPGVPDWLEGGDGEAYVSPLVARIARIRQEILERARESNWTLDAAQLNDQAIIRRMVLKRCIYGVDKNPLAVELAKVSLWLHSFTVGAPLSFLDHHLRCGDSLLGMRVTEAVDELNRLGGLGAWSAMTGAETAAAGMQRIEALSDTDVAEVRESAALFQGVEETTADLRGLLDVLCGLRWLTAGMKKNERTLFESPLFEILRQRPQDAFKLLAHGPEVRHSRESGNPSSLHSPYPHSQGRDEEEDSRAHPSGASRNPGFQPGASDSDRPSRASETIRHSRENSDRHSRADSYRHSRESGNPSSPNTVDSRFHGSDEEGNPESLHSGASQDARHSRGDSDRHSREYSDRESRAESDRHSRASGNPSSTAAATPSSAGLQPASGSAGLQPASGQGNEPPTPDNVQSGATEFANLWHNARAIADWETFLHWEVAFPGVWAKWQDAHPRGGFDAVIGNPPWDRIKLQEVEWFATRAPELARAPTAAARRAAIKELRAQGDPLAVDFDDAKARADSLGQLVRASGHYPLLGGGDINLYSLFVENAMRLVKADGLVGLLTPSGIYADKTAAKFFKSVSTRGRVAGLYDFENRKIFFKDVHASFKFCALIVGGAERRFDETACAFFLHDTKTVTDPDRCFPLAPDDFARVNPNTGTEHKTWPVKYHTMFHMTNDSHLFRTAAQLDSEGFYPVQGNRWQRGKELYLPLYEGKMVQAFDHRAASVVVNPENLNRPAQPREATLEEHANPDWLPDPQFWVSDANIEWPKGLDWAVGFKDVTAPTNVRSMIASIVPRSGFGNTLPLLQLDSCEIQCYGDCAWLWVACLNSFAFDFVARQKVQGQHLNWFVVEQLPVIAPEDYDRQFGEKTARELVRDHVLRLTYTAHDMAPFARDLGYTGPPFIWNEEERRHLRARLDALYFHLYGISREDADYILSTFPIVRRQDQAAFNRYRTRDLIRAYMSALQAGDTETVIDL